MKQRILVVDDEEKLRRVIELQLMTAGFDVDKAGSAEEGLKLAERADLVLTDLKLPGMDGLETMRMIHRKKPKMPIIVISGRPFVPDLSPEPDYLGMATKLGAVCSLPKPFKPADLLATVASCLAASTPLASLFVPNGNAATGT